MAEFDLTSSVQVFTVTPAADTDIKVDILIGNGTKDLATASGTLYYTVVNDGRTLGGGPQSKSKTAGVLEVAESTRQETVLAGTTLTVSLESSNAADSDVFVLATAAVPGANVIQVSDDATAANNLELDYDGTGYAKANSTIGTATAVTDEVDADVVKISGSATAADAVESVFLGTGHTDEVLLSAKQLKLESTDTTVPLVITSNPLYDAVQIGGYNAISLDGANKGLLIEGGVSVTDGIFIDTLSYSGTVMFGGAITYASGIDHISAIDYGAAPTGTDQNATAITATNAIPGTLATAHGSGAWTSATGFAVAGDPMTLADDAIKASKYDESTAFPVASVDSGATLIARTGADSDTLESLSDQIDAVPAAIESVLSDAHGSGSWETASGFFVGSDYFLYDTGYAHSDAVDGSVVRETGDAFSSDYVNQWDVDGDNWAVGE